MTGKCPQCPPKFAEQKLIAGYCKIHYWQNLRINSIKKSKGDNAGLKAWFNYHISNSDWVCENCNKPVPHFDYQTQISCQAHILPKKLFPSVKLILENRMLLGGIYSDCGCHTSWDLSWERASRMPVMSVAIERFLTFRHLIAKNELRLLPEFFFKLM